MTDSVATHLKLSGGVQAAERVGNLAKLITPPQSNINCAGDERQRAKAQRQRAKEEEPDNEDRGSRGAYIGAAGAAAAV